MPAGPGLSYIITYTEVRVGTAPIPVIPTSVTGRHDGVAEIEVNRRLIAATHPRFGHSLVSEKRPKSVITTVPELSTKMFFDLRSLCTMPRACR